MPRRSISCVRLHRGLATRQPRQGVAAVELALCMPLIMLLLLGTIDACSMIFMKQSLTIAAYEGARTSVIPGADASEIEADCLQVTSDRGIQGATVTVTPADPTTALVGDFIAVTVTAPCDNNSILASLFYSGRSLSARVEAMKEYN